MLLSDCSTTYKHNLPDLSYERCELRPGQSRLRYGQENLFIVASHIPILDHILRMVIRNIRRIRDNKHHKASRWIEIALDIAVTQLKEADVWDRVR